MKRAIGFFSLLAGLLFLASLTANNAYANGTIPPVTVSYTADASIINRITFTISGCNAGEWVTVIFGDGSQTDVQCNNSGNATVQHDYPFSGQNVMYHATVGGKAVDVQIGNSTQEPITVTVSYTADASIINRITFTISGCNAGEWVTVIFGDGSQTDVQCNNSGNATVQHDYPFSGQNVMYHATVGGKAVDVHIGQVTDPDLTHKLFLPLITR